MKNSHWKYFAACALAASLALAEQPAKQPEARNMELQQAIREGDLAKMRTLLDAGADANAVDADGTPALMNAAVYGSARHMRLLLERGAKVDAKNAAGATALIYAAGDAEKARTLVAAGADVNAQSGPGRTALLTAAAGANSAATVKLLLDKGAKVDTRDRISPLPMLPTGGGKATPLIEAGRVGDLLTVRHLLLAGADVDATDGHDASALSEAVLYGRREIVKELLASHASADIKITTLQFPILSIAAIRGDAVIAKMLVAAGAKVNATDATGGTPLMWAAYSDRVNVEMVKYLLHAGADAKARTKAGDSALDWALQRGETRVVKMLRAAGSPEKPVAPTAAPVTPSSPLPVEATLAMLAKSATPAFKTTGCASCHNHTLPLVAFARAERSGVAVDKDAEKRMMNYMASMIKPMVEILFEGSSMPPDMPVTGSYMLEAMAAQGHAADKTTAAIVHNVAQQQMADGRWVGWAPRGPMEHGDIQSTALSIRSIQLYPLPGRKEEMDERVVRAGRWLRTATPVTTEDYDMRALGLKWAGFDKEAKEAAAQILKLQRNDGGWGQLASLPSDAYSTAKTIVTLREVTGGQPESALNHGLSYLRKSQEADGTWHVKTRSFPFQPLLDSGFPHGRDQWISAAATSWAAMALLPHTGDKLQTKKVRSTRRGPSSRGRVAEMRAPQASPVSPSE